MTNQDFHVVRATEADIVSTDRRPTSTSRSDSSDHLILTCQPDILGLITELAVYEKEPDAVKATPELVRSIAIVWRISS